jgi:hypothetical protein
MWGSLASVALNALGPTIEKYANQGISSLLDQVPEDVADDLSSITSQLTQPSQSTGTVQLPRLDFTDRVASKIGKLPGSQGRGRGGVR